MGLHPEEWPSVISKDRAGEILLPWQVKLCEPFFLGWKTFWKWKDLDPDWYATITARTRAGIVHDFAVKNALAAFDGQSGIRIRHEFDSILLIFGEDLVARLKKFGNKEKASNSKTSRQSNFDRQCLDLPGIPTQATKITVGYTLDHEQKTIVKVSASCWCVNTHKWSLPLYDADEGTSLFDVPKPSPVGPSDPKSTVRPKSGEKTAEGQAG